MAAQVIMNRTVRQLLPLISQGLLILEIRNCHLGAHLSEVAGQRHPLPGQAEDHHVLVFQTLSFRLMSNHHSRASATPAIAARSSTSQKRCTTWVSDQPSSSK